MKTSTHAVAFLTGLTLAVGPDACGHAVGGSPERLCAATHDRAACDGHHDGDAVTV